MISEIKKIIKKMKEILNISNVLNEGNISTILYTL